MPTIKEVLALEFAKVGVATDIDTETEIWEADQVGQLVLTFPSGVTIAIMPELDFPDEPNMPILKIIDGGV